MKYAAMILQTLVAVEVRCSFDEVSGAEGGLTQPVKDKRLSQDTTAAHKRTLAMHLHCQSQLLMLSQARCRSPTDSDRALWHQDPTKYASVSHLHINNKLKNHVLSYIARVFLTAWQQDGTV